MEVLGIHEFWLFVFSGLVLNITPGPDTAYVVGRSMQLGWRGGAAAALGISCGCLVHVFGAAVGLSALLMTSSAAFTLIKWVGAAYLCFIGVSLLLSRLQADANQASAGPDAVSPRQVLALRQVFWQGALTNVLNPKVALFFLAFLPQFVAANSPHKAAAFLLLGLIFICNGTLWCLGVAGFAARASQRIKQSGRVQLWVNRALGALFIYIGVRIASLQARSML
jgi:threonine/homoserine/homoserine lactone efflux protein